jgi:hypothetical protein
MSAQDGRFEEEHAFIKAKRGVQVQGMIEADGFFWWR